MSLYTTARTALLTSAAVATLASHAAHADTTSTSSMSMQNEEAACGAPVGVGRQSGDKRGSNTRALLQCGAAATPVNPKYASGQIVTQPPLPQGESDQPQPGQSPRPLAAPGEATGASQTATTNISSEEIIVTAQRRSENIQNVPIAITALDSAQLTATGVADTETLRAAVPSLQVTTAAGGFGLPRIRGIGATGQGPGIENPVAVYLDGVYYGASFGVLQSLFDVEQVAVLKGPQGTLFGRNATGGLIQIQTRDPSFTPTASAQFGYGNYDTTSAAAFASVPMVDNLAISISGQYENRNDGFGTNLFTGRDVQDGSTYVGRAKLLWRPGSGTRVLLSIDANGRDSADPAFTVFGLNTLGQNVAQQVRNAGGDRYDILADINPRLRARQWGTGLTIDQELGDFSVKSITAYRKSRLQTFFDPDGTTVQTLNIDNDQDDRQFSQELNLLSPSWDNFKFIAGLFYLNDKATVNNRTTGLAIFGNNGFSRLLGDVKLDSYSAFAEGTYTFGEATNLTAGIRYTRDERSFSGYTISYVGATNVTTTSPTTNLAEIFERPSWRLSLDHRFSPELLVYASYNRGFRAGTFVPQVSPVTVLEPEEVDAFEVGLKSDLFDRRVRINLAGYYFDQSTVQVFQVISGVQNVYNAQGAEIYGVDGDVNIKVTDDLTLFGGFNYNHARYRDFTDAVIGIPFPVASNFSTTQFSYVNSAGATVANTVCLGTFVPPNIATQAARDAFYRNQRGGNCLLRGDASGNRLQNTPDITLSVGGTWDIKTASGTFTLAGNFYHTGSYVGTADERVVQDSYNLVDGSVTWTLPGDHVYLRVFGKNLTNAYYLSQFSASNSGDNGYASAPRTYGAQIGFRF
jgi:iron complex outermembrane receptor protein